MIGRYFIRSQERILYLITQQDVSLMRSSFLWDDASDSSVLSPTVSNFYCTLE